MKLYDVNSDSTLTLQDLKSEFIEMRKCDPENYDFTSFSEYLYILLMDTINGRNDCYIIGMAAQQISNYIIALRNKTSA